MLLLFRRDGSVASPLIRSEMLELLTIIIIITNYYIIIIIFYKEGRDIEYIQGVRRVGKVGNLAPNTAK